MSLLSFTKKLRGGSQVSKKVSKKKVPAAGKKLPTSADKKSSTSAGAKLQTKDETTSPTVASAVSLSIDLQPLVTEKGVLLSERNTVAFRVSQSATKSQIARAIEERYKVTPRAVRTMLMRPKRRRRGRTEGTTTAWKKAYVTVDDIQALSTGP